MTVLLTFILQGGGEPGAIPEAGVRISIWFIAMFLLAIGAALLYMRIGELDETKKEKSPKND